MTALQTTAWNVIEQDIKTLEETGSWPNYIIPAWANETAHNFHCNSSNLAVIQAGLKEIINQLKRFEQHYQATRFDANVTLGKFALDKPDSVG